MTSSISHPKRKRSSLRIIKKRGGAQNNKKKVKKIKSNLLAGDGLKLDIMDFLTLICAPFLLIRKKWRQNLFSKLWLYISKPTYLYTIGSLFVIFEILASMVHIFGYHFPKLPIPIHLYYKANDITHELLNITIPLDTVLFFYFNATVILLILISRQLLKLKEEDKYTYRNE